MSNKPEYFSSQVGLYTKLKSIRKAFDINRSLGMSRYSFCDVDGGQHLSYSFTDFAMNFNKTFGDTINPAGSQIAGSNAVLVTFYDNLYSDPVVEEKDNHVEVSLESTEVILEETTVVIEDKQEAVAEVIPEVEYLPYEDIDWPRIEALKGSAADKLELDQYAAKFGISLKRNKKIGNMLADFKEAVGVTK